MSEIRWRWVPMWNVLKGSELRSLWAISQFPCCWSPVHGWAVMLVLLIHNNVWIRILQTHCLRNLTFKILFKSCCYRILKAVSVPLILLMVDGEVLGHCIAGVLVGNGRLVLREPVDSVGPWLPVVLCQDVLGTADFADNVVLRTRSRVTRTLQTWLAGETFRKNASF